MANRERHADAGPWGAVSGGSAPVGQAPRAVPGATDRDRPWTADGRRPGALPRRAGARVRAAALAASKIVNAVALDDYVRGVVAGEMPASWPAQALEAQAVAARTYALTSDVGGAAFDVYDDTRSQVYGGVGAETAATDAAVAATSGQVVTYHGALAATYFFASSGGYTENVENVWAGSTPEPWLRGVPDPYDGAGGDPYHRWLIGLSPAGAKAKLGALVRGALVGIRVTRHGVSPRDHHRRRGRDRRHHVDQRVWAARADRSG